MYKGLTDKLIGSDEDLISFFYKDEFYKNGKTAVLAGHFMLLYNKKEHSLFPAIKEAVNEPYLRSKIVNRTDVGIFPMRTFKLGLKLNSHTENCKIVLLVNDESYRIEAITKKEKAEMDEKGRENLRQNFFWNESFEPQIYNQLIEEHHKKPEDVFIINSDSERGKYDKSILPIKTFYFSERVLNKKFNNSTVEHLLKENKLFGWVTSTGKEVKYRSKKRNPRSNYCVSGDTTSPCVATSLQLYYELFTKFDIDNIIMMVPKHCKDSVNQAAEIALDIFEESKKKITIVSNLEVEEGKIKIQEHINE